MLPTKKLRLGKIKPFAQSHIWLNSQNWTWGMRCKVWVLRFWGAIKIHLGYRSKIQIPGPHSKPMPSYSLEVGRHLCPFGVTHWDSEGLEGGTPCCVPHCWWCLQERCQGGTLRSWWSWLDWHQEKRILKPWRILNLSASWKLSHF